MQQDTIYSTAQQYMNWIVTDVYIVGYALPNNNTHHHWSKSAKTSRLKLIWQKAIRIRSLCLLIRLMFRLGHPLFNNPFPQRIIRPLGYRLIKTPDSSQRNERLDRYNLSVDGLGCSYWLYRLILRLEDACRPNCRARLELDAVRLQRSSWISISLHWSEVRNILLE
jgi:hypothetical protein